MLAYNSKSNTYATVGQDGQDDGNTFAIVDSTGVLLKEGVLFAEAVRNGNFSPYIEANTGDGTFGVISSRDMEVTRLVSGIGFAANIPCRKLSQSSRLSQPGVPTSETRADELQT